MDEPLAPVGGKRRRSWRWLTLAPTMLGLALVGLLAWSLLASGSGKSLVSRIAAGQRPDAPTFMLPVLWPTREPWPDNLASAVADGHLSVRELRGRPTVINFWASWCIPCKEEAPLLNAKAATHPGVRFIGINVQDVTGDAIAFSRTYRTPYLSVHDPGTDIFRRYGLTGVPETFYLDTRGRIVAHDAGGVTESSIEAGIAAAGASNAPSGT